MDTYFVQMFSFPNTHLGFLCFYAFLDLSPFPSKLPRNHSAKAVRKKMAAMFRKKASAKRNLRRKNFDDDEETQNDDPGEGEPMEAETFGPKIPKANIEKVTSSNSLLSFGDNEGEEESEVFKVKKSKESRRLQIKLAMEKKKKDKVEVDVNNSIEETKKVKEQGCNVALESEEEKILAAQKLEALRAELSKMSKLDDEEENSDEENESKNGALGDSGIGKHTFSIPDAATIHALKKKREMARQLGERGGDYIPLDDTKRVNVFEAKSRLVREDENDESEDEDGPINFSVGGKGHDARKKREEVRTALVRGDENEEEDDDDEETKRWEEEQIRKGVSGPQVQQEQEQKPTFTIPSQSQVLSAYEQPTQAFHSSVYPYGGGYGTESPVQVNNTSYSVPSSMPPLPQVVTMESICTRMSKRLESLQEVYRVHKLERDKTVTHLETAQESIDNMEGRGGDIERNFAFFQEMRGYVRDLIECLNEKVPVIDALEKSIHGLLRQRAERFVQRRQDDVKDQATEYLEAQMGKKISTGVVDPSKQRRAAEREGRRTRRRRQREINPAPSSYHEGMSTDDEETETDSLIFRKEAEKVISDSRTIFEDVVDEFSCISAIRARFEEWKQLRGDSYRNAYIGLCLPKLFKPFVRLELLPWNPLETRAKDLESMQWYTDLLGLGLTSQMDLDPSDDDVKVIPGIVDKTVIPKVTGLMEHVWDPLSTTQTACAVKLVEKLAVEYPTVQSKNKSTQKLFHAIIMRMRKSVSDDVYVPLYPKPLLENKTSGALAFFQRQFWSCFKLFSNLLSDLMVCPLSTFLPLLLVALQ
ncbi:PAX3- and PAX7-binding protein 1 isoform X2 [Nematostella vectensis]|uniref:PAX3- and PAX7-binding protein 1 isoform X2 n=1 Tax=Nematostella vectensis TaxID=45351 RepID=UPI002077297B|nr:PAX3- and PAX7-binding protein 1 isoform X2 [Nematostella vectensis]